MSACVMNNGSTFTPPDILIKLQPNFVSYIRYDKKANTDNHKHAWNPSTMCTICTDLLVYSCNNSWHTQKNVCVVVSYSMYATEYVFART